MSRCSRLIQKYGISNTTIRINTYNSHHVLTSATFYLNWGLKIAIPADITKASTFVVAVIQSLQIDWKKVIYVLFIVHSTLIEMKCSPEAMHLL